MKRAAAWSIAVLSICLAVGLAAGQAPGADRVPVDLVVKSVGFAPRESVPSWTDGVGSQAMLRIVVFNNHTAPTSYEIAYTWRDGDGETPLNGALENSFDVSESPLPSKKSRPHDFLWRLQPGQEATGSIVATVKASGDESSDDLIDRDPEDNALAREVFVRTRSITLTADPRPASIEAEARGFVRVNLRNDGNSAEQVALSIVAAPNDPRLAAEFSRPVVEVPANATLNESLLVTFTPEGDFSAFSHSYVVRADPGFGADRTVQTAEIGLASPGPPSNYAFAVVRLGTETLTPSAGAEASATFRITNTGQRSDVYRAQGSAPAGWLSAAHPLQVGLRPGEDATVRLTVRPPDSAIQGSVGIASLAMMGSLLPEAQTVDVSLRVAGPSPRILSLGTTGTVFVGAPATANVQLTNPGDPVLESSLLTLSVRSPGSPDAVSQAPVGSMARGEEMTVSFPLAPPVSGGSLILRATWTNAGAVAPTLSTETLVHDVALRVSAPSASSGSPGETVAYRNQTHAFNVTNHGNAAEDVFFAAEVEAGSAAVEGDTLVALEPGQSWLVAVRQDLPNPAGARTQVNLTLIAFAGPQMASNTTATRLLDFDAPVLQPSALPPRWNMGPAHALPLALRAQDGGAIAAANATVVAPSGQRSVVALSLGTDGLYHGAAVLLERGNHTVRFAARDQAGNSAQSIAQVVEATRLPAPVIRLEGASPGGNLTNRTLRLSVTAALTVDALHVEIRQNNATVEQDVPLVDGNLSLDLSGFEAGLIQLAVTAADASGATGRLETTLFLPQRASTGESPPRQDAPAPGLAALLFILFAVGAFLHQKRT